MTDQLASQMRMAPMEHAHNFVRVPSLATQETQRQVDLALDAAGPRAALAMPVTARLRDLAWQLESLIKRSPVPPGNSESSGHEPKLRSALCQTM